MTDIKAFPLPKRRTRFYGIQRVAALVSLVVLTASHVIAAQVADPVLNAGAGPTQQTVSVAVTDATPGATIYYTTDGSAPTTSSATIVSGSSITINQGSTLKVQAYQSSATPSSVVSGKYTITGLLSAGSQHTLVLKNDGTAWAWGNNFSGQLGIGTTTNSSTPVKITALTGVTPIGGLLSRNVPYENGLPLWWQIAYLGQTGNAPTALAPNGSGMTLLQSYQQGIDPTKAPVAKYSISLSATGTAIAPGSVTMTANVGGATATIQRVDFYQGDSWLGSAYQSPWQGQSTDLNAGTYSLKAISTDVNGLTATGTTTFAVNPSAESISLNRSNRGWGNDPNYTSSVIALDSQNGIVLDGTNNDYTTTYTSGFPWFLRTKAEANVPWQHILSGSSGISYAQFNAPVVSSGTAMGGAPPFVAFGSQGGGTPLYVGQYYNFGIAAGAQAVTGTNDIMVEVYEKTAFANNAINVAPITSGTFKFTMPRPGTAAWTTFEQNGYVMSFPISQTFNGKSVSLDTRVQYIPGGTAWGQSAQWPMLVSHKSGSPDFVYRVSYVGSYDATHPMAKDSGGNQIYNLTYSVDFDNPSPAQSSYIRQPHFQGTPLPSAYQDKSLDELIHNAPAVTGTLSTPTGNTLTTVDNSPELRSHPVLDKLVTDMGSDALALANYVLNEIELADAIGYDATGQVSGTSINPTGVSRDAMATYMEGQGSPAEQCALLVYLLRKAGTPCGYVFPQQNGTLMFDQQLSKLLRMQIRGAKDSFGNLYALRLIPVNYPWVAAYIGGKWVHIFPWLKDTAVEEGYDLWDYMPSGCQTGAQWLRHYLLNDLLPDGTRIRSLSTEDDNPGTLFPLWVKGQLKTSYPGMSMDDFGVKIYNRRNYYTRWEDFPRPWQTPSISNANFAQTLSYAQDATLNTSLQNIFDTVSVKLYKDLGTGKVADGQQPIITTGTMRLADLHDRRLLLYHQAVNSGASYNAYMSLEAFRPTATGTNNFANGPGDLLNKQTASASLSSADDNLLIQISYKRHRQLPSNFVEPYYWDTYLGFYESLTIDDTRPFRKGDMAALCLNYGRVTQKMQEFQVEKYWNYQQEIAQNPPTVADPERSTGEILYLMGLSYYYKVSQFQQQVEAWTKTHAISWNAHGLAKLAPARTSGSITMTSNGDIDLRYPNVDMLFLKVAVAGNGTTHLDSGDEDEAGNDAMQLMIGETSADEHRVINQFFQQNAAVSTVKLLDLARQGSTGIIELNASNYAALGATNYTAQKTDGSGTTTQTLQTWAGTGLWGQINDALTNSAYGKFTTVFITPGPVKAEAQLGDPYTGMGAFVIGVGDYRALISSNTVVNGGFGGANTYSSYSYIPPVSVVLQTNIVQTSYDSWSVWNSSSYSSSNSSYVPPSYSTSSYSSITSGISSSSLSYLPDVTVSLSSFAHDSGYSSWDTNTLGTGSYAATISTAIENTGYAGSPTYYGNMGTTASSSGGSTNLSVSIGATSNGSYASSNSTSDPVNVITGEFYSDTVDLRLNGPMPLEIRRNYGSLNKADNNFGNGWRMSCFPYLVFSSTDSTVSPTLITSAEMDGSVIVYHKQTSPSNLWIPTAADNPSLANVSQGMPGGLGNVYNNQLVQSGTDTFILTGADGSVRTFKVQSFDQDGTGLTRKRPYLQTWKDNRGNSYAFTFGTDPKATDYGQVNRIQSSNGNYVGLHYDTYGHITEAYTGDGRRLYYNYDSYGDLIQVTLPDASTVQYDYQHLPLVGSGLTGNYYSDMTLSTKVLTRTDSTINFNWGTGSPDSSVPVDSFSARWTGVVVPLYTDTYTFYVTSDDGARLWVNGRLIVDSWVDQSPTEHSGTIALTAGQKYDIRLEYYEHAGAALVSLSWSSAHQTKQIIPTSQLYPSSNPASVYSSHLLTQETKPGGRVLQNNYDSAGRVVSQYSTVGSDLTPVLSGSFTYVTGTNSDKTLSGTTTFVDARGYSITYSCSNSQITQVTDPSGTVTQEWYAQDDGSGGYRRSLKKRTDKRGLVTNYTYDSRGNPVQVSVTGALQGDPAISGTTTATTTTAFNNLNLVTSGTDSIGNVTNYGYGDTAHPYLPTSVEKRAPGGSISTNLMQYQDVISGSVAAYGLLQKATVASGAEQAVTTFINNANGFPTSKTQYTNTDDPNVVTSYTYNLRGELTSETDAAGRSTWYTYDARGNRTGAMRYDKDGTLVSWQFNYYNQNGEIEWTQGPRYSPDDYVLRRYDGAGRLSEETKWLSEAGGSIGTQAAGQATTFYHYDKAGNLVEIDDPRQTATTMTYNGVGQMLSRTVHNGGSTAAAIASESFTYEPGGQVATHTDVLGGVETRKYTSTGLVYEVDKADGTTAKYRYDLTGRVVRETLTNGSYWVTAYDDANRKITRTFYNAGNTLLATEIQNFDRRGNLVSKIDTAGYTFATTYDGLNRPKKSTGPPAVTGTSGATAQQWSFHIYDAAGVKHTVTNSLGERSETIFDAEQRPISAKVWNSDGSLASITGYAYSPDHQSVTTTVGSGTNAVWSQTYTNTYGQPVVLWNSDSTYQITKYDSSGNKTSFQDEVGAVTSWTYDALNHLQTETLPASSSANAAVITYTFDAAGNLITRQMPTGQAGAYLTGTAGFDNAGRKTSEKLLGTDGSITRSYTYHYYTSGAWKGLFQSVDDPRGFTATTTYDDWLRTYTVNSANTTGTIAQQNQNTTYLYDTRNLLTSVSQGYTSGTTGPSTTVTRGFDGYGQLNAETVAVSGTTVSQWAQSWDGAGRRTALNWQLSQGSGSQYYYNYNAAGKLTGVTNSGLYYGYTYADNNLLQQRDTPLWTQTVTARDSRGRVLNQNTAAWGSTLLAETLQWRNDSKLDTYAYTTAGNGGASESRSYTYDKRGRVTNEPFVLSGTQQSATYKFDQPNTSSNGVENGLGVRTLQFVNSNVGQQVNAQNTFKQPTQDLYVPDSTTNSTFNWLYDAAGNAISRAATGAWSHTFTWDARGRMVNLVRRDSSNNGYNATNVFDGLGRRVQSTYQQVTGGSGAGISTLTYYYDPQVEFLQLGNNNAGVRTWNIYGPDGNGVYGGQQGTGGLEAFIDESSGDLVGEISNYFGDVLGQSWQDIWGYGYWGWWGATLGSYGAMPGSSVNALAPQWRGLYADLTGYYLIGERIYFAPTGRFLSADSLGHAASMSLYAYCNGDGVNFLDPTGRCGSSSWSSYGSNAWSQNANIQAGYGMDRRSQANFDVPTFSEVVETAGNFALQATVGTAMSMAQSTATNFYNGLTGTDINTGAAISGGSRLASVALFALDVMPMAGEVKLGGGAMRGLSSVESGADALGTMGRRLERLGYDSANSNRILQSIQNGDQVVVVGENMRRVNAVANMVNDAGGMAVTYTPVNFTGVSRNALEADRSWIRYWAKDKGAPVIDIGRQPTPRVTGPSPFYGVENRSLNRWGIYTPFNE